MKLKRHILAILAALMALGILAPSAFAGGTEIYTAAGGCQFKPATWVPGTTVSVSAGSHSESSSESMSFTKKKVKKAIRKWEKVNHRKIAIRFKPKGIKGSHHCMNPEKQGIIKAGDLFKNNALNGGHPFWDIWQAGWKICHYREVTIGGQKWLKGTKKNCGNREILIPLHFKPHVKYKVVPSREFKSYRAFWRVWVSEHRSSSESESGSTAGSTATTEGHYTCEYGWTLEGNMCKKCPPPPPPVEPPPSVSELTVTIGTINDMEVSRDGHVHTRYICWEVAGASSIGAIETALVVEYGEVLGAVEYRGGIEFCQLYKSPSEEVTEEYFAWATDTQTGAHGESKVKTFPIYGEAPGWNT
jgi:hypothetical protein